MTARHSRDLVQRHGAADNARERQLLWASCSASWRDAVNAWIFRAPRWATVVPQKGLRSDNLDELPIFVHDICCHVVGVVL